MGGSPTPQKSNLVDYSQPQRPVSPMEKRLELDRKQHEANQMMKYDIAFSNADAPAPTNTQIGMTRDVSPSQFSGVNKKPTKSPINMTAEEAMGALD
jgi:hypothetical protein